MSKNGEAFPGGLDETWKSPFGEMAKEDPVIEAAEAMWSVHYAARQENETNEALRGKSAPMIEEQYAKLIERKDILLEKLTPAERRMAEMHAQLVIGPIADPEVEIYEIDESA